MPSVSCTEMRTVREKETSAPLRCSDCPHLKEVEADKTYCHDFQGDPLEVVWLRPRCKKSPKVFALRMRMRHEKVTWTEMNAIERDHLDDCPVYGYFKR